MKILVCGSSRNQDREHVFAVLDAVHKDAPATLIINGGARGTDFLSSEWAKARGISLRVFRTDRERHGERAFFNLNETMLEKGQPELIVAFPGGGVTSDLIDRARAADIPVLTPNRKNER